MSEITLSAKEPFFKKEYLQKTLVVIETGFIFFFVPFYFLTMILSSDGKTIFEAVSMAVVFGIASFLLVAVKYENDIEELKNEVAHLKGEQIEGKKSVESDVVITKIQKKILLGLNGLVAIFIAGYVISGFKDLFHEIPKIYESAIVLQANNSIDFVKKDRERLRLHAISKVQELQLQVNRLEAEKADREKSGKGL